jgi:hypothetical protein
MQKAQNQGQEFPLSLEQIVLVRSRLLPLFARAPTDRAQSCIAGIRALRSFRPGRADQLKLLTKDEARLLA